MDKLLYAIRTNNKELFDQGNINFLTEDQKVYVITTVLKMNRDDILEYLLKKNETLF